MPMKKQSEGTPMPRDKSVRGILEKVYDHKIHTIDLVLSEIRQRLEGLKKENPSKDFWFEIPTYEKGYNQAISRCIKEFL